MSCERTCAQLTAYLDGEVEGDRGSAVRGHLRECATCRQVATDEAALRDGLRLMPPVDPPASLWAGVQARLAAAEVADSKRPAWKRATRRWLPSMPSWPQLATGGALAAAAVTLVWWRSHREVEAPAVARADEVARIEAPHAPAAAPRPTMPDGDVTAELQADGARVSETYGDAAEELLALAVEARPRWTRAQQEVFDTRVAALRGEIDRAREGRSRQRAWRSLIRYLQRAVVRDDVALAGGAQ